MVKFELSIEVSAEKADIVELISTRCQLSKNEIKSAINKGVLWLTRNKKTKRLRKVKQALTHGDILHFYYDENVLMQSVPPAELVQDLTDYSIWYKPFGMLCQGSKFGDHCTINRFVESKEGLNRPSFIIHRLDKAATGLIIIGHTKQAAKNLAQMFEQKALSKSYQIITHADEALPDSFTNSNAIDEKPSISHFQLLKCDSTTDLSLYQVDIETGRKHQIRKHAAEKGIPVVGDRLHGLENDVLITQLNLQLCAVRLQFNCPITGKSRDIKLPQRLRPNFDHVVAIKKRLIVNQNRY